MKYQNSTPLPNNFLAEQAILNLLLTNSSLIKEAVLDLKPESFYFEDHKFIYETICELYEKNTLINLITVVTSLQDKNLLKKIGGISKINTIIDGFENFSDLNTYIKELNDKYLRRVIIDIGKETIAWGYTTSENLETILDKMEYSIFSLSQESLSKNIYSAAEVLGDVYLEIQSKMKREISTADARNGLKSSFKDLDSLIQGFQKSDLIVVAGRPSMGKTAFSLNLGKNIVEKYNVPLLIFSLEMSRQQIIYRFISTDSKINANKLKSGNIDPSEWKNLSNSMKKISELPIYIDDNPNLTLLDIRIKLRKIFTKNNNNGLVILDYLQLMKMGSKLENRVQEISYITRNLKILAKEFKIPIMALSQLSRNVESRTNKRPMLSDLRESGCLTKKEELCKNRFSKINKKFKVTSWNKSSLINENIINLDFKGIKPTFSIFFTNGLSLCLTSNHKILSKKGWIRAFQIQEETEIYCLIKSKNIISTFSHEYYKVKKVFYEGINKVYYKTIPGFHNYLTKNIILHNSIEQDADIVIMLYREDYYNDTTSEEQITEIIVAKHRNGSIGTAKILFKPATTLFTNL